MIYVYSYIYIHKYSLKIEFIDINDTAYYLN